MGGGVESEIDLGFGAIAGWGGCLGDRRGF